ncbi:hypothetical protein THTE_0858 [Thermogutta terrifontis]|uniref:Uncharacterized protein n=1 Tax=Thermogutta terrifontis TaxID=1331910 RepID=A0A286RBX9_9BACT|nr:hypothetical protein THTE_0858 [Thermogutta terrifontis]
MLFFFPDSPRKSDILDTSGNAARLKHGCAFEILDALSSLRGTL